MRKWTKEIDGAFWYVKSDDRIPIAIICGSELHANAVMNALNQADEIHRYPVARHG